MNNSDAIAFLGQDAKSLLTRLDRVNAYSLRMPMVAAAGVPMAALSAMESSLEKGCRALRSAIRDYIAWLGRRERIPAHEAQHRFVILKLRFNNILSQFDIFADVLNQRSEHDTGVWLSGLDIAAADALRVPGFAFDAPPVICYLDRGHGAAIRRARTRLPGGDKNPVAIVRVPRERMVGSGIASSLVHEVGHQGGDLLGLVNSIRPALAAQKSNGGPWLFYARWISEILADFWAIARVGVISTMGLMGVVSLPRPFVFRISLDDPHPFGWIRVKISCAIGDALYPHPQWKRLSRLWELLYPAATIDEEKKKVIKMLEKSMPELVKLLLRHRPKSLRGKSLSEVFRLRQCQPLMLQAEFDSWRSAPGRMAAAPPSLLFAAIGQAKADGKITAMEESKIISDMLRKWALGSALSASGYSRQSMPGETTRIRIHA